MSAKLATVVSEYKLQPVDVARGQRGKVEILAGEHLASETQVKVFKIKLDDADSRTQQLEDSISKGSVFAMDAWAEEQGRVLPQASDTSSNVMSLKSLLFSSELNSTRKSLLLKNLAVCLDTLHGSGIAHGSICLANIWIEDMFYVSLGPFCLPFESIGGLLLFMPPEVVLADGKIDQTDTFEADIWAMAIVFCLLRYGPKMYREMEKVVNKTKYLQFLEVAFCMNINSDYSYTSYKLLQTLKVQSLERPDRGESLDLGFLEDCREDMNKITLLPSLLSFEPQSRLSSKDLICLDLIRESPSPDFRPRHRNRTDKPSTSTTNTDTLHMKHQAYRSMVDSDKKCSDGGEEVSRYRDMRDRREEWRKKDEKLSKPSEENHSEPRSRHNSSDHRIYGKEQSTPKINAAASSEYNLPARRRSIPKAQENSKVQSSTKSDNIRSKLLDTREKHINMMTPDLATKDQIATFGVEEEDLNNSREHMRDPRGNQFTQPYVQDLASNSRGRGQNFSTPQHRHEPSKHSRGELTTDSHASRPAPFYSSSNAAILDAVDSIDSRKASRSIVDRRLTVDQVEDACRWRFDDKDVMVDRRTIDGADDRENKAREGHSEKKEAVDVEKVHRRVQYSETVIVEKNRSKPSTPTRATPSKQSKAYPSIPKEASTFGRNTNEPKTLSIAIKISSLKFIEPLQGKGEYLSSMISLKESLLSEGSTSFATDPLPITDLPSFGGSFSFKLQVSDLSKLDDVRLDLTLYVQSVGQSFKRYLANASIDAKACMVNCAMSSSPSMDSRWALLRDTHRQITAISHIDVTVDIVNDDIAKCRSDSLEVDDRRDDVMVRRRSGQEMGSGRRVGGQGRAERGYCEGRGQEGYGGERAERGCGEGIKVPKASFDVEQPKYQRKIGESAIKPSFSFGVISNRPNNEKKEALKREIDDLRNSLDKNDNLQEYPKALSLLRQLITKGKVDNSIEPN